MAILIGVDIGQGRDPSGISVAESAEHSANGRCEVHLFVRYLERLPFGASFLAIADRVEALVAATEKRSDSMSPYVDATGVGQPIVICSDLGAWKPSQCTSTTEIAERRKAPESSS